MIISLLNMAIETFSRDWSKDVYYYALNGGNQPYWEKNNSSVIYFKDLHHKFTLTVDHGLLQRYLHDLAQLFSLIIPRDQSIFFIIIKDDFPEWALFVMKNKLSSLGISGGFIVRESFLKALPDPSDEMEKLFKNLTDSASDGFLSKVKLNAGMYLYDNTGSKITLIPENVTPPYSSIVSFAVPHHVIEPEIIIYGNAAPGIEVEIYRNKYDMKASAIVNKLSVDILMHNSMITRMSVYLNRYKIDTVSVTPPRCIYSL